MMRTRYEPIHVAAYIESRQGSAATIKQHIAAIQMLFSWPNGTWFAIGSLGCITAGAVLQKGIDQSPSRPRPYSTQQVCSCV